MPVFFHRTVLADENRLDKSNFTHRTRIVIVGAINLLKLIALVIGHYYLLFGTSVFDETYDESRSESSYISWIPITRPISMVTEFVFTVMLFVAAIMEDRPELLLPWLVSYPITSVVFIGTFGWINVVEPIRITPSRIRNAFATLAMLANSAFYTAIAFYCWHTIFNVYRRLKRERIMGKMFSSSQENLVSVSVS